MRKGFALPTVVALIGVAVIVVAAVFLLRTPGPWGPSPAEVQRRGAIACTQEAMQCPDGSYVGRTGPNCEFAQCPTASSTAVDTSGWKAFTDQRYGVTLKYPANWQVNGALGKQTLLRIGHPLSGMAVYMMTVEVKDDPQELSPKAFVAKILADDAAEDVRNGAPTASPPVTPSFAKEFDLTVGGYPAFELYRVFRFDEHTEQIYVQHGATMLVFEFPVAEANPNLSEPVANSAIAHEIINTLILKNEIQ